MPVSQIIKESKYKVMPWKNGKGRSFEIDIFPKQARLEKNDFLWRLSSAQIDAASDFSSFPQYNRILAIVAGGGVFLNELKLEPLVPHRFAGEDQIKCSPIGTGVKDLGLIYRRDKFEVNMMLHSFWSRHRLSLGKNLNFFFCAEGRLLFEDKEVSVGDAVKVHGQDEVWFECAEPSLCFQLVLREITRGLDSQALGK